MSAPGAGQLVRAPGTELSKDWTPVKDKATGDVYYWNERTDEVTAVGETPGELLASRKLPGNSFGGFSGSLMQLAAYGAGVTVSFAVVRSLFG